MPPWGVATSTTLIMQWGWVARDSGTSATGWDFSLGRDDHSMCRSRLLRLPVGLVHPCQILGQLQPALVRWGDLLRGGPPACMSV